MLNIACALNDAIDVIAYVTGIGIGGSGTTNYIPKFTSTGVVANSTIQDSGTAIQIANPTYVTGSLTVTGNLTAQQFIVSSSVTYLTESFVSGSHKFGDSSDDNHNFTGSVYVTGSISLNSTPNASFGLSNKRLVGSSGNLYLIGNDTVTGMPNINFYNDNNTSGSYISMNALGGLNLNGVVNILNSNVGLGIGADTSIRLQAAGSSTVGTVGTETILLLSRDLTSGVSFQQAAAFKLGRYATAGGVYESRTRLDIALKSDTAASNYSTDVTVMTLTNQGYVGVGTVLPSTVVHAKTTGDGYNMLTVEATGGDAGIALKGGTGGSSVGGWTIQGRNGGDMVFVDRNSTITTRMVLPGTGGILVGHSSKWDATVDNSFRSTGASYWALNANSLNTGSPYLLLVTTGRNTSSDLLINCETNHTALGGSATTGRFRVDGAGIIYATNTTVQSISDIRTKENIIDAESGLNIINNLKVRRFDFKDGFGDNKKNQLGFIAQEIETVFPEAVGLVPKTSDSQDNDIQYKTVGPGALIPVLVKAIQDQQQIINDLKDRIITLESK